VSVADLSERPIAPAISITGDHAIDVLLAKPGVAILPARACRFDGFVDDTQTEYANPSIVRPPSVQQERLESTLTVVLHRHHGPFYLGLVMYDSATGDEDMAVWIGARLVGTIRANWNDNRRHLFVVPVLTDFRGGERIRFITAASGGPYRVECIALSPRLPDAPAPHLEIATPSLDVAAADESARAAVVTWLTNRPSLAEVTLAIDGEPVGYRLENEALVNHEVVVRDLPARGLVTARIVAYPGPRTGLDTAGQAVAEVAASIPPERAASDGSVRFPLTVIRAFDTPLEAVAVPAAWPITWGIPFAAGRVPGPENVRLLEAAESQTERELPCQVTAEARWPDGTVRWALLDFQAPLARAPAPAAALCEVIVEAGPAVRRAEEDRAEALVVEESENAIVVTTGPARLTIPRDRLVVPGHLSLRRSASSGYEPILDAPSEGAALLVGDDGTAYWGVIDTAEVEVAGAKRVVIRIDARHRADDGRCLFRSVFRIHLFRGQSFVRLFHTFENDNVTSPFTTIRSLALRCALAASATTNDTTFLQDSDTAYVVRAKGAADRLVEGHADGMTEATLPGGAGVLARVRDFWQNYPKAIGTDGRTIEIGICPALPTGSFPPGHPDEDRLYFYLVGDVYRLKCGIARTHEIVFVPFSDDAGRAIARSVADLFQAPPVVRVAPFVYLESGALSEVAPRDPERLPDYERWVDAALHFLLHDRAQNHDYGMLNFGDWYRERRYNWGNMEYDSPLAYATEYLRGGDTRFLRLAEPAARHLSDVDTCHHDPDPLRRWGQYAHCIGHVGDYYPRGYREAAIAQGMMENSHTWVEGLFLLALLTGDARYREAAVETTRRIAGARLNDFDFKNCRDCGWPLIHLMGGYQATGERYFLNGARVIVERVLEKQRPSGGWDRLMVPGHCFCDPPRHMGEAGFMVGVLLDGLKRYHQATNDPRVAEAIVRAAGFLIRDMWVPELSCFRYTSCPRSAPSPEQNIQVLEGLAYAYRLSGDDGIRSICLIATKSVLGQIPLKFSHEVGIRILLRAAMQVALGQTLAEPPRGIGKEISTWLRSSPHILYDICHMIDGPIRAETVDIDA
jgi:hypothetical protein